MTGIRALPEQDDLRAPERAWQIAERRFSPELLARHESVFAVGNGYLGLRGAPRRARPRTTPG